ncbi:MAG: ATP-dependent sacrificial sulfur transferase LarE [Eubacterium sp.]|nr:ATP-dependent sacrificial sulfur transferase LarE [Eubacterium sp.]
MKIKDFFEKHNEVAVAFSGGVDSAVLLLLAKRYANRVKAYYVKSQFQPEFELKDAMEIAKILDAEIEVMSLDVLSDKTISNNPENRCYYCKRRIFSTICNKAKDDGFSTVIDGTNASDKADDRPGMKALSELGVYSPLRICAMTKSEIRAIAKESNLPVADKPSYACLATRIKTNTPITAEALEKTEKSENILSSLGFRNYRVRYNNGSAVLELGLNDFAVFYKKRKEVYSALSKLYDEVYLNLKEREDE